MVLKIEKNQVPSIVVSSWTGEGETLEVKIGSPRVLNDFLQKGLASVGPEKYFIYDSKTQNCQYFIKWNLSANGLWSDTINKFVMQDAVAIYKNLGFVEKAVKGLTDTAGIIDHVLRGSGRRTKKN